MFIVFHRINFGFIVSPKDPVTSSFTRAVNAGHTEAVARARMQQQQEQLLAQTQPKTTTGFQGNLILPKAEFNDRYEGKIDLWDKIALGLVLSDSEMRQLFHSIELQQYSAQTATEKRNAAFVRSTAEEKLAKNIVQHAQQTQDGKLLIQGVSVPVQQAFGVALKDVQFFAENERHLRPDELVTDKEPLGIVSPESVLKMLQNGQVKAVKQAHISRYYTWADFFNGHSHAGVDLATLQSGAKIAKVLDILSAKIGSKIPLESWYRNRQDQIAEYRRQNPQVKHVPLRSRHIIGDGVDIAGSRDYQRKVYAIARSTKEIRRIGFSTVPGKNILHLDLMQPAKPAGNTQVVFHDNGTHHDHFVTMPLLDGSKQVDFGM